jgi:hypothetical protein
VWEFALQAIAELKRFAGANLEDTIAAHLLLERLERAVLLLTRVLDQTQRRFLRGQKVPAGDKVGADAKPGTRSLPLIGKGSPKSPGALKQMNLHRVRPRITARIARNAEPEKNKFTGRSL